jgi:hypothetical protein
MYSENEMLITSSGTPTEDFFDTTCQYPANQYFWLNPLLPNTPIHDVLAQEVARQLVAGPNIC